VLKGIEEGGVLAAFQQLVEMLHRSGQSQLLYLGYLALKRVSVQGVGCLEWRRHLTVDGFKSSEIGNLLFFVFAGERSNGFDSKCGNVLLILFRVIEPEPAGYNFESLQLYRLRNRQRQ
jgi:hypothetical protein